MFRLDQPKDVAEQLSHLMDRAGISHYSGYPMLGYYDGLVRFWATDRDYGNLLKATDDRTSGVSITRTLLVSSIRYTWIGSAKDQENDLLSLGGVSSDADAKIRKLGRLIETVAKAVDTEAIPPSDIETLAEAGLLLYKPKEERATIKVFILLQPIGDLRDRPAISENLLALRQTGDEFTAMSLYEGEGTLCTHMIRLTVASYEDILQATRRLDAAIANYQYRTTTLFVGINDINETDNINNINRLTSDEHQIADRLGIDKSAVGTLNTASRQWLVNEYNEVAYFSDDRDIVGLAIKILTAAVNRDRDELRGALSFIVDLEYYFRTFVINVLSEAFKDDWVSDVADRFRNPFKSLPPGDVNDPRKWPLGVALHLLREVASSDEYVSGRVLGSLGENWYQTIRPVFDLRNEFAHGRLLNEVSTLNDFSGDWGDKLACIVRALPLHAKLCKYSSAEYFAKG